MLELGVESRASWDDRCGENSRRKNQREGGGEQAIGIGSEGHWGSPKSYLVSCRPFLRDTQHLAGGVPNLKNGGILRFLRFRFLNHPFINPKGW